MKPTLAERFEASWMARYRWSTWVAAFTLFCIVAVARCMQNVGSMGDWLEDCVWHWSVR
jgi:hypothetical protein